MVRVLIVASNPGERSRTAKALGELGFETEMWANGRDALDRIRSDIPDLVLSDLQTPGLDGLALCRAIRSEPRLSAIPFVLCGSNVGIVDVESLAESLGVDRWLIAPLAPEAIAAEVLDVLTKMELLAAGGWHPLPPAEAIAQWHDHGLVRDGDSSSPVPSTAKAGLDIESFLLGVASEHLSVDDESIGEPAHAVLERLGEHVAVDALLVLWCNETKTSARVWAGWRRGIGSWNPGEFDSGRFRWMSGRCADSTIARIEDRSQLPANAQAKDAFLENAGLDSMLLIPLSAAKTRRATLLVAGSQPRAWKNADIGDLVRLGEALGGIVARAEINRERRQQEARSLDSMERIPAALARMLPDGTVTFMNAVATELSGYPVAEILGRKCFEFFADPLSAAEVKARFEKLTPDSPDIETAFEIANPRGVPTRLVVRFQGLFADDGSLSEILAYGRDGASHEAIEPDLGNRLRFERFLNVLSGVALEPQADSSDRFREILPSLGQYFGVDRVRLIVDDRRVGPEPIEHMWAREGCSTARISLKSDRAPWAHVRLKKESLIAIRSRHMLPPEAAAEADELRAADIEAIAFCQIKHDERLVVTLSISSETARDWSSDELDQLRILTHLSAAFVFRDAAERARERSEWLVRNVVQHLSEAIVRWRVDGTMTFINEAAASLIGIDPEAIVGQTLAATGGAKRWEITQGVAATIACGLPVYSVTDRFVLPGGKVRFIEWRSRGVFDAEHELIEIQSAGRDRTDHVLRTREAARQLRFHATLSWLSTELLKCSSDEFDERIPGMLERIAEEWKLCQIAIWSTGPHEWRLYRLRGTSPLNYGVVRNGFQNLLALTDADHVTTVHTPDDLPESASAERARLAELGIGSFLVVPFMRDGERSGGVSFSSTRVDTWAGAMIAELESIAGVLVQGVQRARTQYELETRESDLSKAESAGGIGSWSWNVGTKALLLSDQLRALLGPTDWPTNLTEFAARIHPESQSEFDEWIEKAQEGAGLAESNPFRLRMPDDQRKYVTVSYFTERNARGSAVRIFGTVLDVTRHVESTLALAAALTEVRGLKERAENENAYLRDAVRSVSGYGSLVGESPPFRACLELVKSVAKTNSTVLLLGETGTGKELLARAIHDASDRRSKPLVSVNCAALSESLIESELFGHERGAFTGAHARRIGRFELADGGTLFLDEIGDLSLPLQVKLLRVLQEGEIERVGSAKTQRVDVRVIAATHRNLAELADSGAFRADLYYRLNRFPIRVPALRERAGDIPTLARYLVAKHAERVGRPAVTISRATLAVLEAYDWPGNVRELESLIERALIINSGPELDLGDVRLLGDRRSARGRPLASPNSVGRSLEEVERDHILAVLEETGWVIEGSEGAAFVLGLKPSTLRSRARKLGIVRPA